MWQGHQLFSTFSHSILMKAVLLAGGSGTRFWPLSREMHPKQFLKFAGDRSLLQGTMERLLPVVPAENIHAITHKDLADETCRQLEVLGFDARNLIAEPVGRNTSAAVALAARLFEASPDEVVGFFPADHLVENTKVFEQGIRDAEELARLGFLVTLGIPPLRAETGYGYIESGEALSDSAGFKVKSFREKPDVETANTYLKQNGFFWNSGMLFGTVGVLLREIQLWMPELSQSLEGVAAHIQSDSGFYPYQVFNNAGRSLYEKLPELSIDYGVLERSQCVAVVPCEMDWCDVGSWEVLNELFDSDEEGNVKPDGVELLDCTNNLIHVEGRLIAALGIDNLIVVDTPDALLVCRRDRAQDIRKLVEKLKSHQREEVKSDSTVAKPWGSYTDLIRQKDYLIKRITVMPGHQLSLQAHDHRSEHWVVVSGEAEVECDGSNQKLKVNESTFIPKGAKHRLSNPGKESLVLVEIQIGPILSEDDITRYEDRYGRADSRD